MKRILEVNQLSKRFLMHILGEKEIPALDEVSFEQEQGEILGLTGKSGSGKSTLMKCIYRTYLATGGQCYYLSDRYGRIDLATASTHQVLNIRRREMTYCSQFLSVIPRVPAVEVVAQSLLLKGVEESVAIGQAKEFLERLGLPQELWDAYPSTFSGGEQQRINVARAIISKPRFLLIDEPTASLDQRTKDVVIDSLRAMRESGTSVVLITHDTYTLGRLADRELKLAGGRISEAVTV